MSQEDSPPGVFWRAASLFEAVLVRRVEFEQNVQNTSFEVSLGLIVENGFAGTIAFLGWE